MRFLADECCDMEVVRALRAAGHDVVAAHDSLSGAEDAEVINVALRESRVLLTEDKDFGQLLQARSTEPPGVIFLRYPATARKSIGHDVVELVRQQGETLSGCFAVVEPGRIRISRPRPLS